MVTSNQFKPLFMSPPVNLVLNGIEKESLKNHIHGFSKVHIPEKYILFIFCKSFLERATLRACIRVTILHER